MSFVVQKYQTAIDEFLESNPDWGKGIYATVSTHLDGDRDLSLFENILTLDFAMLSFSRS
jgi:hypothetical protein